MTFKNHAAASLLLLIATSFPGPLGRASQSLGEVARKYRKELEAREKKGEAPAKVFTNDDIARMPGPAATVTSGHKSKTGPVPESTGTSPPKPPKEKKATTPAKPAAVQTGKPESATKSREYWQARFRAARSALAHAKEEQKLVEDEIRLLRVQQARQLNPGRSSALNSQIEARSMELQAKQAATQKARQALEETEKEFKKSGAPEDWIREGSRKD